MEDPDGELGSADVQQTVFLYDRGQIILQFDQTGDSLIGDNASHRYLWGPAVDQLLADENVVENETLWALTDRQGNVGLLADNNGVERIRRVFDSYGNILSETHYDEEGEEVSPLDPGYLDEAFAYTGRLLDKDTGLQNNLNRWYDAAIGQWLSEDPIGFAAGDPNLRRYVGNSPTNGTDPSGWKLVCGPYVLIYVGSWCADESVYNAAMGAAGEYLFDHSPVRGAYGGVGTNRKLPGHGSPAGQVGVTCGWTIDNGGFANVGIGIGRQERTRDPRTGRFNKGFGGVGYAYGWSEDQGWGGAAGAYCGQTEQGKKIWGGGHGGIDAGGGVQVGINYGPIYGGVIIDPKRLLK